MKFRALLLSVLAFGGNSAALPMAGFAGVPTHRLDLEACHALSNGRYEATAPLIGPHPEQYRPYLTLCPVFDAKRRVVLEILELRRDLAFAHWEILDTEKVLKPGETAYIGGPFDPFPNPIIFSPSGIELGRLSDWIFDIVDDIPNAVNFTYWRKNFPNRIAVWVDGSIGVNPSHCAPPMLWDEADKKFIQQTTYMPRACK
jgi:hypothetical protein